MFTLTLHKIGTYSNDDLVVGKLEDRTCHWKVEIYPQRRKFHGEQHQFWPPNTPPEQVDRDIAEDQKEVYTEPDLFKLNGIYPSYEALREALTELRLSNAVELFELGHGGSVKSYRKLGYRVVAHQDDERKYRIWETTCGHCGSVQEHIFMVNNICQNHECSVRNAVPTAPGTILGNNFEYLIPETILDGLHAENGKIYHCTMGRMGMITNLGVIKPHPAPVSLPLTSPLSPMEC